VGAAAVAALIRPKGWSKVEPVHFLNVDLEVRSREPLDALAADLGEEVVVLYCGPWDHQTFFANFELASWGGGADSIVERFCYLLTGLDEAARALWDHALARSFNLGFESGGNPRLEVALRAETVRRLSELNAELVVTIYPPTPPGESQTAS
jgi:hypothetical protein